jgi:hypothetical protein
MNSYRLIVAGLGLMALGSCSPAGPVLLNASQEGLVVRYNPGNTSTASALAAAQEHCAKYGRTAAFESSGMTGDIFATYFCVKP